MIKDKVILFGRGQVFARKSKYIFDNYDVLCFIDNAVKDDDNSVVDSTYNLPVFNPSKVAEYPDSKIIVLSYAVGAMTSQLLSLGVDKNNIIFGPMLPEYNIFETMLFKDKEGFLSIEDEDVYYINTSLDIKIKTNPFSLEDIIDEIRDTDLYPSSKNILEALSINPIDDTYGMLRGKPVDRYYIEKFLDKYREYIKGSLIEIGDREYTEKYGADKVSKSVVIHAIKEDLDNNIIKGDLVSGQGIDADSYDCFICTQTLPFIYDIKAAAENIVRSLKVGGVALITVAGISQIIDYERRNFGHFWSFTDMSLEKLFKDIPGVEVLTETYGNVKSATAFLYGISSEEMEEKELDYKDSNYQVIVTALIRKVK